MNKYSRLTFIVFLLIFGCQRAEVSSQGSSSKIDISSIYHDVEFEMPEVKQTSFPDLTVNIIDHGAVSDGVTKNTQAFEKAIEAISRQGGGTVLVPRGIWLTGPIIFKSNINLHLEAGALIQFSKDFDDYPLVETSFEGLNTVRCISPIYADGVENIAITGEGTLDGNGDAWRPVKKSKMTDSQWKSLLATGGMLNDKGDMWFPSNSSYQGYLASSNFNVPDLIDASELETVKDFLRPVMVSIKNSKRILLDGPTFQNSPAWNIHPLMNEDLIIRNLNVRNPWYSQNGDGLDLESCKNVLIYNNIFDVGDDAICFKSGKDKDGRERGMPTENVIVKNNIVYHGHGGFVIGSEMSGGVRNVHISSCTFMGTDVGLRFKSTRGRGGIVEHIYISDIDMINIPTDVINFNMFYGGNSPVLEADQSAEDEARDEQAFPVNEETPIFRNIHMKNIKATNSGTAANFQGLPEMNLQNVTLENALLQTKNGILAVDSDGLQLKDVRVIPTKGAALTLYNSKNVEVVDFSYEVSDSKVVKVLGSLSSNISLRKQDFKNHNDEVEVSSGASVVSYQ
ncbi:glycoside hydrolase family 28 protein [Belliella sp. DSM 111904]|uniref:Glycoside hydrolase family 28 protein n=1 Tax=Belliella filtrata TaxID=2923435 RepID=A0ABS9UWS8_9BACT|nr:glycoside hydrolase family 28 protein [Belliella filtrata]MCH7408405.1 glycoside hydrolase family 28 protein [Belliella filtrata]